MWCPRPDGSDPNALPHRDHVRHHAVGERQGRTTSGRSRATARSDDEEVTDFLRDNNHTVVMQDVDALNLLQRTLGSEPTGYQELSINIDTGGLAARRILARLVEEGDKPAEKVL